MPRRFRRTRSLIDQTREQLHLAAAVASEAVLRTHLRYALELVEEGSDRAPVERLLDAYARLHHLAEDEARKVTERVLVSLGEDGHPGHYDRPPLRAPKSVLRRAAHRLRGRVNLDLREWVDRHTARAELALLDVHVHHAHRFVMLLFDQGSPDEAISLYTETMELRPMQAEMVRLRVLADAPVHGEQEGAEERAAETADRPDEDAAATIEAVFPRTRGPLRLAEEG